MACRCHEASEMTQIIVFLSGWAGSGKDTSAELLIEEMGFHRVSFADSLKEAVADSTGFPLRIFHDPRHKNDPLPVPHKKYPDCKTYRDILIAEAAAQRAKDPNIYVRTASKKIRSGGGRIVITDWRYPNEYSFIKEAFPDATIITIRVDRQNVTPVADISEHLLDDYTFDVRIGNDGTITDLRYAIKYAIHSYL
jgi:hypothetical protein